MNKSFTENKVIKQNSIKKKHIKYSFNLKLILHVVKKHIGIINADNKIKKTEIPSMNNIQVIFK